MHALLDIFFVRIILVPDNVNLKVKFKSLTDGGKKEIFIGALVFQGGAVTMYDYMMDLLTMKLPWIFFSICKQ